MMEMKCVNIGLIVVACRSDVEVEECLESEDLCVRGHDAVEVHDPSLDTLILMTKSRRSL